MKKAKKIAGLIIFCILLLVLSACNGGTPYDSRLPNLLFSIKGVQLYTTQNPAWLLEEQVDNTSSHDMAIHLFLDGGKTMRGFVDASDSAYCGIVSSIPAINSKIFETYTLLSYKFSDNVYLMKDKKRDYYDTQLGEEYLEYVFDSDFYGTFYGDKVGLMPSDIRYKNEESTDYINLIDAITTLAQHDEKNSLYIIVTDFIPELKEDPDAYRMMNKIYTDLLSKGYTCGVAGFQSSFNGDLFGLGEYGLEEPYAFSGQLPFYLTVIGDVSEVSKFMSELVKTAKRYNLQEGEMEVFITNGKAPILNSISKPDIKWVENSTYCDLLKETKLSAQVSNRLLDHSQLSFSRAYTLYPIENYIDASVLYKGWFEEKLPFDIPDYSSIEIETWDIDYSIEIISGEQCISTKALDDIKGKEETVVVPSDMSISEFQFVFEENDYGRKVNSQDDIEDRNRFWKNLDELYFQSAEPILVNAEDMIKIENIAIDQNGNLKVDYSIVASKLKEDMPYYIVINVAATPVIGTKGMDEWISNWDIDANGLKRYGLGNKRTVNLSKALAALQGNNLKDEPFVRQYGFVISKSESLFSESEIQDIAKKHLNKNEVVENER